jgi:DNA-binding transcriptional LysR family regulator
MARGKAVAGTLRIAAPYEFGAHHLGAVSCAMLARYPDLRVDLDVDYGRVDPLDRRYDIVFSMFDEEPDSARVAHRAYPIPRGLYAAPSLLERSHPLRRPEDLADLPAIASTMDAEWSFLDFENNEHRVPIRPRMRSPNADVRRRATVEGLGVSRIVRTFCAAEVKQRKLVELLPDYACAPLVFYALLPGRRLMPPKVRIFLEMLST